MATNTILVAGQNLGDVENLPAARSNLGVYATSEVYTKAEVLQLISAIPQATPGSKWLTGDGVPALGLGNVGDFYLDLLTSDVYEKTGETTWILTSNISGSDGRDGVKGEDGINGQDGENGTDGEDGPQGEPGLPGDDAESIVDNEKELLNVLTGINTLKTAMELGEEVLDIENSKTITQELVSGLGNPDDFEARINSIWITLTDPENEAALAAIAQTITAKSNAALASANDYTRTSVGYCQIGGSPSSEVTKAACDAAGGTWIVGAPLATSVEQSSIQLGDGTYGSISQVMQTYQTIGGGIVAEGSLLSDVNGYISGIASSNNGVESSLDIIASKFRVGTEDGGTFSPTIFLDQTDPQNPVMTFKGKLILSDGNPVSTIQDIAAQDGATWHYVTSGAPASGLGKVGDFALSSGRYVYEKISDTTWQYRSNLTGATGSTGSTGASGADGDDGNPGPGWFASSSDVNANGRQTQLGDVRVSGSYTQRWNGSSWVNTSAFIDGPMIVTGGITSTQIAANTITANNIAANTITANKLDVSNLFAQTINATGSITYGSPGNPTYISLSGSGAQFGRVDCTNLYATSVIRADSGGTAYSQITSNNILVGNSATGKLSSIDDDKIAAYDYTMYGSAISLPTGGTSTDIRTILNSIVSKLSTLETTVNGKASTAYVDNAIDLHELQMH